MERMSGACARLKCGENGGLECRGQKRLTSLADFPSCQSTFPQLHQSRRDHLNQKADGTIRMKNDGTVRGLQTDRLVWRQNARFRVASAEKCDRKQHFRS